MRFPKITNPLKMEYIKGKNIYECNLSYEEKKAVLEKVIGALDRLHRMDGGKLLFKIADHKTSSR